MALPVFMNFYFGLDSGQLDEENLFEEISDIDLIHLHVTSSKNLFYCSPYLMIHHPQLLKSKRVVAPPRSKKSLQTKRQTLTMVFNNVKENHMHYHYNTPDSK